MTAIYLAIGLVALISVLVIGAFYYGKKDVKSDAAEEALKRAKIAKDVRSGKPLDDKFLRRRD